MKLTREQQVEIATFVSRWVYQRLISTTAIPKGIALVAAIDAANAHGRILQLTIEEHSSNSEVTA